MVVWEEKLPEELPRHYSSMDVTMFSRWYLNDYPVNIWNRQDSLLVLYLFIRNAHRVEKAMVPILNGIRHLSAGNPVCLEESGELAEISASLNKAGDYLLKNKRLIR